MDQLPVRQRLPRGIRELYFDNKGHSYIFVNGQWFLETTITRKGWLEVPQPTEGVERVIAEETLGEE